jgi:hypothetical protein
MWSRNATAINLFLTGKLRLLHARRSNPTSHVIKLPLRMFFGGQFPAMRQGARCGLLSRRLAKIARISAPLRSQVYSLAVTVACAAMLSRSSGWS